MKPSSPLRPVLSALAAASKPTSPKYGSSRISLWASLTNALDTAGRVVVAPSAITTSSSSLRYENSSCSTSCYCLSTCSSWSALMWAMQHNTVILANSECAVSVGLLVSLPPPPGMYNSSTVETLQFTVLVASGAKALPKTQYSAYWEWVCTQDWQPLHANNLFELYTCNDKSSITFLSKQHLQCFVYAVCISSS